MGNMPTANRDPGVQFTSNAWIGAVEGVGVRRAWMAREGVLTAFSEKGGGRR